MGNKSSRSTPEPQASTITKPREGNVSYPKTTRESVITVQGEPYSSKSQTAGNGPGARLANIFMAPVKIDENYAYPKYQKGPSERKFIQDAIADNFIFSDVENQQREHLLDAFEKYSVDVGFKIITEGDIGDYFYIIQSGKVEFSIQGERVGDAGSGRGFGDLALLYDCPRACTCIAAEASVLWRVDQTTFRQILAHGRVNGDKETIETLRKVNFLQQLSDEYIVKIASAVIPETFKKGEVIIKKGEPGSVFYILKEGSVAVRDIESGKTKYEDQVLKQGDFFGERAIVTDEPRNANVVALEDCLTLTMPRQTFLDVLGPLETLLKKTNDKRLLKSIPHFTNSDVNEMEYSELISRITEMTVEANNYVYKEDSDNEPAIYLIRSGSVQLSTVNHSAIFTNTTCSAGGYFGVQSTVYHQSPIASALAMEKCVLGVLTKTDIRTVIRTMTRLNQDPIKLRENELEQREKRTIHLNDLKKHRILGIGTFGKVWLVSRKVGDKTETFALKIQSKRHLLQNSQVEGVIREIKVMSKLNHPFILSLVNVYHDDATVMMLLKLVQGGELYSVIKRHKNMILPERDAKFYSAGILEGLHYMHYHSIIYRDLKPENVLIETDGYPVIVDLGFAKEVKGKTFTLCGTPWYIAPEVIMGRGHDKACDYWSWAILVHEMVTGETPFQEHGVDQMTLFKGIVKGNYKISRQAGVIVEDLIKNILVTKAQYRLGNLSGGCNDIKTHPWLKDVDFNKLSKKIFRAPWAPNVKDPLDVDAFDNWDHIAKKDGREKPLTENEQKHFSELNSIIV